jgi:hypothetical protein
MIKKEVKNKTVIFLALIGILLIISAFSVSAFGQQCNDTYKWVVSSGDWTIPDNWRHEEWNPATGWCEQIATGIPGIGNDVDIENAGEVTIDSIANAKWLGLGRWGGYGTCYLIDNGALTTERIEVGSGTFSQSGGTNTVMESLTLGIASLPGLKGRYELSGNSLLQAGYVHVGGGGDGTFIQTDGTSTIETYQLDIGSNAAGTYELYDGYIAAYGFYMGCKGKFVQYGGKVTVYEIIIGQTGQEEAVYDMRGGILDIGDELHVGEEGKAHFIMDGGSINGINDYACLKVLGDKGRLTGQGDFNIKVDYMSEEIYGANENQSVDLIFEPHDLEEGGTYNVEQLITPTGFAGGKVEKQLLKSSAFSVTFDGHFSGKFTIAIPYDEADIATRLNEDTMRLHILHETGPEKYEKLEIVKIDKQNNIVYGEADSLGYGLTPNVGKFAISGDPFLVFNATPLPPGQSVCQLAPASLTLNSIRKGHVIQTWKCFSGAYAIAHQELMINNSHFVKWTNLGPIPPGVWRVGAKGTRKGEEHPDWFPLYPEAVELYSRDGDTFYIHGEKKLSQCTNAIAQSKGCIAIEPGKYNLGEIKGMFVFDFENTPNVKDALSQNELLLFVVNFSLPRHDKPNPYVIAKYILKSPANLFLQTENGHVCGYDPDLGEIVNDIDGATYSGPGTEPQVLTYPLLSEIAVVDHLTLTPTGAGGPYELEVSYHLLDGSVVTAKHTSQIRPGEQIDYVVTISPDAISLTSSEPTAIPATIDFNPDTLNLKSEGNWITCYIELPGYDVEEIDVSTVRLQGVISAESRPIEVGDNDDDGVPDLMVKFDRSVVQDILEVVDEVEMTVSGELNDGTLFEGSDKIRVIE